MQIKQKIQVDEKADDVPATSVKDFLFKYIDQIAETKGTVVQ